MYVHLFREKKVSADQMNNMLIDWSRFTCLKPRVSVVMVFVSVL